jgi:hypothetical protein
MSTQALSLSPYRVTDNSRLHTGEHQDLRNQEVTHMKPIQARIADKVNVQKTPMRSSSGTTARPNRADVTARKPLQQYQKILHSRQNGVLTRWLP